MKSLEEIVANAEFLRSQPLQVTVWFGFLSDELNTENVHYSSEN